MNRLLRILVGAAGVMVAAQASSFTFFNLASADSALIGISGTGTLTVGGAPIGPPFTTPNIDFFPFSNNLDSLLVGDSTFPTRYSQMYSFTYEVTNPTTVNGMGIILQGILGGSGFISFTENIYAVDGIGNERLIGSMGNGLTSSGTTNNVGSLSFNGNSYTYQQNVNLVPGATHYKVKKSFFLAVDPQNFVSTRDFAGISLIEQTHLVPEPMTIGATLIGLAGLARIKRRKK